MIKNFISTWQSSIVSSRGDGQSVEMKLGLFQFHALTSLGVQ